MHVLLSLTRNSSDGRNYTGARSLRLEKELYDGGLFDRGGGSSRHCLCAFVLANSYRARIEVTRSVARGCHAKINHAAAAPQFLHTTSSFPCIPSRLGTVLH